MYQVWTKDEFGESWNLTECETTARVKESILAATKAGHAIKVSLPMEFSIDVNIKEEPPKAPVKKVKALTARKIKEKEVAEREATESGPAEDQGPGSPGNSSV